MEKKFFLPADKIRELIEEYYGGCVVSDQIMVGGQKVGYMYREEPDESDDLTDNGWHFLSGNESQDYVDDPDNFGIYHMNTIANYDPEIIPFIYAPFGSAFERDENGVFIECPFPQDPPTP